jgi:hypothetical protein
VQQEKCAEAYEERHPRKIGLRQRDDPDGAQRGDGRQVHVRGQRGKRCKQYNKDEIVHCFFAKAKRPAENSPAVAAYSIRASFSQERTIFIQDEAKIVYQSKDGREEKVFDAPEWLGLTC